MKSPFTEIRGHMLRKDGQPLSTEFEGELVKPDLIRFLEPQVESKAGVRDR